METEHSVVVGDARAMDAVPADSIELVVTSPPYPMIEMWDETFSRLDPAVADRLAAGDGRGAFELMHEQLRPVWEELERVLVDGGIACINVGDATRTVGDRFRVYPNHARVVDAFDDLGFDPLPEVLWHKPTNSAAKFMGSGVLPPNAYVTLEHEYLLPFRNGSRREFAPGADRRYEAAYFWEERNRWFSDVWTDVRGELQAIGNSDLRNRSAAFPFEIPYRLICMFSAYGDTVLDPFWGTGTTGLAAAVAGRSSIGYELEGAFAEAFDERIHEATARSRSVARTRLDAHRRFVAEARADGETFEYEATHYDFPVTTARERRIRLYAATGVSDGEADADATYRVEHEPVGPTEGAVDVA